MECPLVSICIPVYNVSKFIECCTRSLLSQTYTNIEYIFVDDCTPDDSISKIQKVLDQFTERKDYVKIIKHKHNRGLAVARNTGIDNAHGEFIMHVDSDDWLEPDAVECLVKKQQETNADIVSGNAIAHYSDHDEILSDPECIDKNALMHQMLELTIDHVIWRRLIKKSLYTKYKIKTIEGINIGEDHYTLPRLIYYANKCSTLDNIVYHYNCMNDISYMRRTSEKELLKRFYSDIASINVLIAFFEGKDDYSLKRLKEIKFDYISPRISPWYFGGDKENYNRSIREIYSLGNAYLARFEITGSWRRFVHKSYFRYHTYNQLKKKLSNISLWKRF